MFKRNKGLDAGYEKTQKIKKKKKPKQFKLISSLLVDSQRKSPFTKN
ncbi:hypothetical protein [Mycoplasma sp. ATU-Cv-508]